LKRILVLFGYNLSITGGVARREAARPSGWFSISAFYFSTPIVAENLYPRRSNLRLAHIVGGGGGGL